jgi:hypothetical protein
MKSVMQVTKMLKCVNADPGNGLCCLRLAKNSCYQLEGRDEYKRRQIKIGCIYVLGIKCGLWVNITNKMTVQNCEVISDKSEFVFT